MKYFYLCAISILLTACVPELETGEGDNSDVTVYIPRGNTQCDYDPGITVTDSAEVLAIAGIDVVANYCGSLTGVAFPAVCGGPSGDIIAHQIRRVNLTAAEEQGYLDIQTLVDKETGRGYQIDDCDG